MIKRYKKWKNWKKYNTNCRFYQFLVLIGLAHSPTFEVWYYDVGSYVVKGFANGIGENHGSEMYKKVQKLCRDMADISKLRAANENIRNQMKEYELKDAFLRGGHNA